MERYVRFVSRTEGADKIIRVAYYFGRIILAFKNGKDNRLQQILQSLSETRAVLRLFGVPQTLSWLTSVNMNDSNFHYTLMQIISMLIYYPMDHLYYLNMKGVCTTGNPDAISLWSCRAWFFYLAIDIVLAWKEWTQYRYEEIKSGSEVALTENKNKQLRITKLRIIGILADLPLALHWSLNIGFLPDILIGVFGTISSITGIIK